MTPTDRHRLQSLIHLARECALAYAQAAASTRSTALRNALQLRAQIKLDLLHALAGRLQAAGCEVAESVRGPARLRLWSARIRAALSAQPEAALLRSLEACEWRLLTQFDHAIAHMHDAPAAHQLRQHLPQIRATRDEMQRLKLRLAY